MANDGNPDKDRLSTLETKVGALEARVESSFTGFGARLSGIEKQLADIVKASKTNWGVLITAVGVAFVIGAAVLTPIYANMLDQRKIVSSLGDDSHSLEVGIVDRMAKAEGSIINVSTKFEAVHGKINNLDVSLKDMETRQAMVRAELDIKIQGEIAAVDAKLQEEIRSVAADVVMSRSMLEGRIERELEVINDNVAMDNAREEREIRLISAMEQRIISLEAQMHGKETGLVP